MMLRPKARTLASIPSYSTSPSAPCTPLNEFRNHNNHDGTISALVVSTIKSSSESSEQSSSEFIKPARIVTHEEKKEALQPLAKAIQNALAHAWSAPAHFANVYPQSPDSPGLRKGVSPEQLRKRGALT